MSTALAIKSDNSQALQVASDYLEQFGNKLSKSHRTQFLNICQTFNLNPFIREIYGVPYGDKFSIIVGYEVYLKRAEHSGLLAGWKAWTEGEGKHMKGCLEINRKDWDKPFYHEVYLSEYDQGNSMWKSKPMTMIKKVVIAQGFRMAFPVELGGLPYTSDEIATEPAPPAIVTPIKAIASNKISREEATIISNEMKHAKIEVSELFAAFNIKRLGELETGEFDKVIEWIQSHASSPEVIDGEVETPATGATDNDSDFPDPPVKCQACGADTVGGKCSNKDCPEAY